ncbi:MAG: TetR/AcrR family transcriptional regulator [Verrucomicrobiota bacterium]
MASDEKTKKILDKAKELFLHHGYAKVTLSDIAEQSGYSRPTVYQVFPNKEEIFKTLLEQWAEEALQKIRQGMNPDAKCSDQLRFAMTIWIIEPYQLLKTSPQAAELLDCSYGFAKNVVRNNYRGFEALIVQILNRDKRDRIFNSQKMAQLISFSLRGFKAHTEDVTQLKRLVDDLIELVVYPEKS